MRSLGTTALLAILCIVATTLYLTYDRSGQSTEVPVTSAGSEMIPGIKPDLSGGVISGRLANETTRAELGRATWKLLHTMAAQYPENPTEDERDALKGFIFLLSRLYPCGECAEHFQLLLKQYPPQTSSRFAASQWACAIHNKVNERLGKEIFNCADIEEKYPCGCNDEKTE